LGLAFHCARDGKVSIIAAPGGWPIWTSPVQPGCEHDTTPLRAHPEMLPLVAEWTDTTHGVLADWTPKRSGERRPRRSRSLPVGGTSDQRTVNLLQIATRVQAEHGSSLL
jgi:hypothetical protein